MKHYMNYLDVASHDVFRYGGGLNGSSAEVYFFLLRWGPMTACEIVQRTGRSKRTVHRVLRRMARIFDSVTGELLALVEKQGDGRWRALENVNLDLIAEILGTAGIGEKQRKKHAEQRRFHARQLSRLREESSRDVYPRRPSTGDCEKV